MIGPSASGPTSEISLREPLCVAGKRLSADIDAAIAVAHIEAAVAAKLAERDRCREIIHSGDAERWPGLARHLAFETDLLARDAINALATVQ